MARREDCLFKPKRDDGRRSHEGGDVKRFNSYASAQETSCSRSASVKSKGYHGLLLYASLGLLCLIVGIYLGLSRRAIFTLGSLALLSTLLVLFVRLVREIEDKSFVYLVFAALIIRCAIAIALHAYPFFQPGDAASYHKTASALSLALLGAGQLPSIGGYASGYIYYSSFIYAGLGANVLILNLINCFVGVACGAYVYKIALRIWTDRRAALLASSLALLMPGILVWSTINYKDSWVNLFVLIAIWRLIQIRERGIRINDILILVVCIGALLTIRFYIVLIIAPLFFFAVLAGRRKNLISLGIIFLILILVFSYAFIGREIMGVKIGLEQLSNQLSGLTGYSGSSTGVAVDISSPRVAIAFLPKGLVLLLFSPFPWNTPTSTLSALALPEMIVMYLLWPFIIMGIITALRIKLEGTDIVLLFTICASVLYALLSGNIGLIYRMRTPIMLLLFIFAAGGILRVFKGKADVSSEVVYEAICTTSDRRRPAKEPSSLERVDKPIEGLILE